MCPIVADMEHHDNSKETGDRGKETTNTPGSKHGNLNVLPRWIGPMRPSDVPHFTETSNLQTEIHETRNKAIAALN